MPIKGTAQHRPAWLGKRLYVYYCAAIDCWDGWVTEAEFIAVGNRPDLMEQTEDLAAFYRFKTRAFFLAKECGWEGDIREGPFVAALPSPGGIDALYVLAWKQDNNGDTMIASPVPLPWLEASGSTSGPLRL
jgi:hypothetical protein